MNTLYARRNPVLERVIDDVPTPLAGGCILDLRMHWTPETEIKTEIPTDLRALRPGQTIIRSIYLTPGTSCGISFAARHPTKPDVYYGAGVTCTFMPDKGDKSRYIVQTKVFLANGQVFYVTGSQPTSNSTINSIIDWPGGYILIDLGVDTDLPMAGDSVEPFNIIFDPIVDETPSAPVLVDKNQAQISMDGKYDRVGGRLIPSGNIFTNSPVVGGEYIKPDIRFELLGDALQFSVNTSVIADTETGVGVKSINGLPPENGNLNVQLLK